MTPTDSDASMTFAVDIPPELVARAVAALAEVGVKGGGKVDHVGGSAG